MVKCVGFVAYSRTDYAEMEYNIHMHVLITVKYKLESLHLYYRRMSSLCLNTVLLHGTPTMLPSHVSTVAQNGSGSQEDGILT